MRILTIFIILFFMVNQNCLGLLESLKSLRDKANKIKGDVKVMTESTHGAPIRFNRKSDILYPGLDKEKEAKIKQLWKEYYDCQQVLYETTIKLVVPDAVAFFESTNAKLECEVCLSPRDMFLETKWLYSKDYNMDNIQEIRITDNVFVKNDSLHINNLKNSDGGLYVCQKGNHFARPYIMHVFYQEISRKVVPVDYKDGEHPAEDLVLKDIDATLVTRWGEWTQCSRCDQVGKRVRQGICTMVSNKFRPSSNSKRETNLVTLMPEKTLSENLPQPPLVYRSTETLKSTHTTQTPNINCTSTSKYDGLSKIPTQKSSNVSVKEDLELLDMFEEGIPCRSKLLSSNIRNLEDVVNRKSEVMISYCKVPCPKNVVFVVVDEKGKIVETANNSAGVYSVLQGVPQTLPGVSRTVEFAYYEQNFTIQCPGNRNGDIPVEWYVGRKALSNKVLDLETNGRIRIDEYNRIVFNPVLYDDSRIFSCWQRMELVGTVRLIVEKKYTLGYQRNIMIIGTIIIFYTFGSIYYKAFTRRQSIK